MGFFLNELEALVTTENEFDNRSKLKLKQFCGTFL